MKKRIDWPEYALKLAEIASLRSEDPFMQVGACALDFKNRVIGVAYNGLAPNKDAPFDFWTNRSARRPYMIHAETNLLSLFKRGDCRLLACTLLPCSSCATMIAAYGIETVVYRDVYNNDCGAYKIFEFYNINLIQIKN